MGWAGVAANAIPLKIRSSQDTISIRASVFDPVIDTVTAVLAEYTQLLVPHND